MMLPATTASPPNFLTPSRRPRLSRPLREEPPAFLCAIRYPSPARLAAGVDLGDPQYGLMLAMGVLAPVVLPPLLLEDDDLVGTPVLDQGGADRGAGDERRAGRTARSVADHQHLAELDRRARLAGQFLDRDHVIGG